MLTRDSVTVSVDAVVYYRLKRLDQTNTTQSLFLVWERALYVIRCLIHKHFLFSPGQTNWYLWQGVQCNLEQNLCRERPSLHLPLITGAWWWWRSFSVKKNSYMKKSHQCILPDDPHQYFGNKKSAWNSQVNCPKSPFSSHCNKSRDWWNHFQWPWGNCTWYEEDARYRHRALGNQGNFWGIKGN